MNAEKNKVTYARKQCKLALAISNYIHLQFHFIYHTHQSEVDVEGTNGTHEEMKLVEMIYEYRVC
jgi:hypothetical protein